MKINEVRLKNFRSHSDTTVNFDDGINLLLGHNGSGKSSVLEGLSFALLDIPLREGARVSKTCIKKGQGKAVVEVDFTGNDGNQYTVCREVKESGNPMNSLAEKGKPPFSENRPEILNKVKEILEIEENGREIFENIIIAKQNAIIDQFLKTPADRKKFFNQILNTEIYDKIATTFCKEYINRIRKENTQLDGNIEILKNEILPLEDKRTEKTEIQEMLSISVSRLEKSIEALNITEKEIETVEKLKNEIENLKNTLTIEGNKKIEYAKQFKNLRHDLLSSLESGKILRENEKGHDDYIVTEKEVRKLEEKLNFLEKEIEQLGKKSEEIEVLKNENKKTEAADNQIQIRKESMKKEIVQRNTENGEMNAQLEKGRIKWSVLNSEKKDLSRLLVSIENINRDIQEITVENKTLNEIRKRDMELLKDPEILANKLESLKKEKNEISGRLKKISELENKNAKLEEKLNNLEKSQEQLKTGMCPILSEKCKNIELFNSIEEYFEEKREIIYGQINANKEKIAIKGDVEKELEIKIRDINNTETEISDDKKNREKIRKTDLDLKINEENYNVLKKRLMGILKIKDEEEILNAEKILDDIRKLENKKGSECQVLESEMKIIKKRYEKGLDELKIKNIELENIKKELENNENMIAENIRNIREYEGIIKELPEKQTLFAEQREIRNDKKSKLEKLWQNYSLFVKHYDNAKKTGVLEKRKMEILENILLAATKIKSINLQLENLNSDFNRINLPELKEKYKNQKEEKDILMVEKARQEKTLNFLKEEIKRLNGIKNELIQKRKTHRINRKKIDLASVIQKNLKYMGAQIAGRFREEIQELATENLRKISDKDEFIRWNEDYGIEIADDELFTMNVRDFSNLSGGEQVTVALCMRSAMALRFSNMKLAIFDEPTPNLDTERRERLAESLKPLLGELEQAIIITHERDFEEMAQKTIILENRDGETHIAAVE